MVDQASDVLKDYQALAQQSWDAWTRYLQQQAAAPYAQPGAAHAGGEDLWARSMAALKGYNEWMQGAVGSGLGQGPADWQQAMQNLFSSMGGQPFAHAFASIDSEAARSFMQLWQSWLQSGQSGVAGMKFDVEHFAAFGYTRERQLQQQALAAAMQEYLEWAGKYQALIQRANGEGMERLQATLANWTDSTRQVDSLKALYDLWVDGAEDAYAKLALSEEFRHVYGEMVNAQSRLRQLQQEQLEAMCRELGMPTRSEVSALGKRLHELRREVRDGNRSSQADEVAGLRAEVAALKRQLATKAEEQSAPTKKTAARSSKREVEDDTVVRRAKPTTAVAARKSVVRGSTRTRK